MYVWDAVGKRVIAMFRYNAAAASSSGSAAFLSPDGKTVFIPYSASGPVDSLWDVGTPV